MSQSGVWGEFGVFVRGGSGSGRNLGLEIHTRCINTLYKLSIFMTAMTMTSLHHHFSSSSVLPQYTITSCHLYRLYHHASRCPWNQLLHGRQVRMGPEIGGQEDQRIHE